MKHNSVFISYSHKDRQTAFAVDQWLRNKGVRVIIDDRNFQAGDDLENAIGRCISDAGKVVCIYSASSAVRPYVVLERRIASALDHQQTVSGQSRLIYFCIDETEMPIEARAKVVIRAQKMSFLDACVKLWHALSDIIPEPKEIDLSPFEHVAPWNVPDGSEQYLRSSLEVDDLLNRFEREALLTPERLTLIEWIAQGPNKYSVIQLESIVLQPDRYSRGELIAAKFAIDDLHNNRRPVELGDRVEEFAMRYGMLNPRVSNPESAKAAFLQRRWLWSRPSDPSHSQIISMMYSKTSVENWAFPLMESDAFSSVDAFRIVKLMELQMEVVQEEGDAKKKSNTDSPQRLLEFKPRVPANNPMDRSGGSAAP